MIEKPGQEIITYVALGSVLLILVMVIGLARPSRWMAMRLRVSLAIKPENYEMQATQPLTASDRIWDIVALGETKGPTDLSENVDEYLVESYRAKMQDPE